MQVKPQGCLTVVQPRPEELRPVVRPHALACSKQPPSRGKGGGSLRHESEAGGHWSSNPVDGEVLPSVQQSTAAAPINIQRATVLWLRKRLRGQHHQQQLGGVKDTGAGSGAPPKDLSAGFEPAVGFEPPPPGMCMWAPADPAPLGCSGEKERDGDGKAAATAEVEEAGSGLQVSSR